MAVEAPDLRRVLEALERHGLLLLSDARLPSMAAIVAGEPIRGSWWGHARGRAIYAVATRLDDRPDVVTARLVDGKVTFVHRRLWPALAAVAGSAEPWQRRSLSAAARSLLSRLGRAGTIRTDERSAGGPPSAEAVRELERRLLARSEEIHTERGAHAKRLEPWSRWAERCVPEHERISAVEGRARLEQALRSLAGGIAQTPLPWQTPGRRKSR